jgi:hypothetical protein
MHARRGEYLREELQGRNSGGTEILKSPCPSPISYINEARPLMFQKLC